MMIASKNERSEGKINGILNNKNYEYDFHFNSRSDLKIKLNQINYLPLCEKKIKLKTPDQVQAPSCEAKTKGASRQ